VPYRIRRARPEDAPRLADIERAAGQAFAEVGEELGAAEVGEARWFLRAQRKGLLWLAVDGRDAPVAFALFETSPESLHLEEIDVHPDHARRGLGRRLIEAAADWARGVGHARITLSTFRHVPWNAPYYARLGFRELPPEQWTPWLRVRVDHEARNGLDPERRLVMVRDLVSPV
jgi:GNAT superfamily N-acetyltransferase